MAEPISIQRLNSELPNLTVIDVRKSPAKKVSGLTIRGAQSQRPFAAETWHSHYKGSRVVVFCVHGAEVSQAVCGFLVDCGIEAYYLEGGFEGWQTMGCPVVELELGSDVD